MIKRMVIVPTLVVGLGFLSARAQDYGFERIDKTFEVSTNRALDVILDVDAGEVNVEKGTDPGRVVVELEYEGEKYDVDIDFNSEKNRLQIVVDRLHWMKRDKSEHRHGHDNAAVLNVFLPDNVDIRADVDVKAGQVTLSLGGLRMKELTLDNLAGEVEVSFDEPNAVVMDECDIHVRIGETRLVQLGNARFLRADINGGIGDMRVDFTGALEPESRARVDLDIGQAVIIVPSAVAAKVNVGGGLGFLSNKDVDRTLYKRGGSYYSDNFDKQSGNKFYLKVTPGLGELDIRVD